jgi:protein transport protein SEC24
LRPPQPAVYLFLLDVSSLAQQSGYLDIACQAILEQLDNLPGDARTQVGFIAFNSAVHFYNIAEGYNQPHEITVLEVDGKFSFHIQNQKYDDKSLSTRKFPLFL